jgi:DNA polymerase-1
VLAYETNDEVLIDILEGGLNLHDHNTETLFHISSNDPKWKLGRRAAKIFMFGGISYGGGDREIYEKVILEAPELGLTFGEYRAAKKRFMDAHPAYAAWAERVKRKAREERIATTFAGGKRFLTASNVHDVEKQGLNSPIQGGAAHVINRAMVAIDEEIEERGLPFNIILQVHDQLVYEVPLETVSDAAELVQRHMEAPTEFYGRTVVFPVDVEIGLDWGSLESYTPEVHEECLKARR